MLVGLMGAGKTTVGRRCARRLERPLVDTDALVEATSGATVPEIFASGGEAAFRELEVLAVADACASPEPLVIACGGGAVLDSRNRSHLRGTGVVVWLQAPASVLAARVAADPAERPLLGRGAIATLERLATTRAAAYESVADATVDTDGRDPDAVADDVLAAFRAPKRGAPCGG